MVTARSKNAELAAASRSLAGAAHHIRQAVSQKIDEFATTAAAELDKATLAALVKGGQAQRQVDALMKKAQGQLTQATNSAKRSMHQAVRQAEKNLLAMEKSVQARLSDLQHVASGKPVTRLTAAKKPVAKNVTAKKVPVKKAAPRKRAA
jgi:vacuolar-type H+-ATPase subunit E/Vma4